MQLNYKRHMSSALIIESRIASYRPIVERHLSGNVLIVCDQHTYEACGKRILDEYAPEQLLLLDSPKATLEAALRIADKSKSFEGVLAVGSGTINDLCKYASFVQDKPYAVVATAPSMNGYVSATSSLVPENGGLKQSYSARSPVAVVADVAVLAAAPPRLIQSGLGDSLARPTAQVDWLLSHVLLGTAYDEKPFELTARYEKELFENSDRLIKGDAHAIELLFRTLIASGEGMCLAGGSYPASQGEHMIAHTMEMLFGDALPETYHGEQISVTTLTMAKLQEEMLSQATPPRLKAAAEESNFTKMQNRDDIEQRLSAHWHDIRKQLKRAALPYAYLRDCALKAGCPVTPEDLGWNETGYQQAMAVAHTTRDRFTFLDFTT